MVVTLENKPNEVEKSLGIRDEGPYSTRNTSKGALIDEASRVFTALASGQSVADVREQVLNGTLLSQRSSDNRRNIWKSIQQRYIVEESGWLTSLLADECAAGPHSHAFISLLYLLYALRDRLTYNFVADVLWPKGHQGRPVVSRDDVLELLNQAAPAEAQIERWTESTRIKLAGSILTALRDFGLLEGKQKKFLVRPTLPLTTAEALLRILITEGCRGREVLQNNTWRLFLLTEAEVASTLAKLSQGGRIRFEKAGATVVLETPSEWEGKP